MDLRRKLVALAALAALGAASACGGSGSSDKTDETVTLSFWNGFTGGDRPGVEHLVSEFNTAHPKIHVNMQIMPWDVFYQKLLPAYGAGKGPDMTAMSANQVAQYASKRVFQPLDDAFSAGLIDKSKIVPGAVQAGLYAGKQYGLPANFTPLLLYYNKKLFKQAGIAAPPATWDEWIADLKKLTKGKGPGGKPAQYGLTMGTHETVEGIPILLAGQGGGVIAADGKTVTLDSPQSIQAMTTWTDLIRNDHVMPVGTSGADADKLMQAGDAAMEINGPWLTSSLDSSKIDYGLAMVPAGPAAQTTLDDSVQFSLGSRATGAKKKAAEEFFSYWNSRDSQIYFANTTGFPPTRTDIGATDLKNPNVAVFSQFSPKAVPFLPGQIKFAQMQNEVIDPSFEKILNGKGDPASVLKQSAGQLRSLLSGS
ncbi:ABC transporter substrate-binding protein [Actinomadura sp. DC4]|uniref:ABC transporter substrate-binding protein n=1 Tax=Actinomadura sp. DC4 TaxID=3055069 RepID=UPI0025B103BC|nr:ABC transporter substrate-binding protein [Actinomadura sp. DC4]MDN3358222.1 ABC transporter substrate-binding protein [Actinomadura sp. DC4]